MVTRILNYSVILLILLSVGQISTQKQTASALLKKAGSSSNSTEIEGSASGPHSDVETNGSGYPTDDEDGDDVHGSGAPIAPKTTQKPAVVASSTATKKPKENAQRPPLITVTPAVSTTRAPTPKEVKIDDNDEDEDDDDDEDYEDEEDDDDFADENIHTDDGGAIPTTAVITTPYVVTTTTTTRAVVVAVTTTTASPKNRPPTSTSTVSSGPFSPFHETMTNGFYAAIAGGVLVAVITAILLVLFVVFRIRKKDEGSYALDEPKQTRPYATYAYTKASTKEFYA